MSLKFTHNGRRMMGIGMRESAHGAFGRYLLNSVKDLKYDNMPKEFQCKYVVPAGLCIQPLSSSGNSNKPYLTTASIFALFDEICGHHVIGVDKNHRPGFSVLLDTEMLLPVYMNDEVVVATHIDKIGKAMGFCTMELYDKDGKTLLARGKQVKFMPAGFLFNVILSPQVFPIFLKLYDWIYGKRLVSSIDHLLPEFSHYVNEKPFFVIRTNKTDTKEIEEIGAMYNSLSIEKVTHPKEYMNTPGHAVNSEYYVVHVTPNMLNPLDAFHGGAVAASLEDTCRLYKADQCIWMDVAPIMKHIEVRYMSFMKGELIVQVHDDLTSPVLAVDALTGKKCYQRSYGCILHAKKKQVNAEFTCTWSTSMESLTSHHE